MNKIITKKGEGQKVESGDTVVMHYTGTLLDGTKFDSSKDRGEPFVAPIGMGYVIKGWDEGIVGMQVGERAILTIEPEMGYGDSDMGNIPANSTLVFELELLQVYTKSQIAELMKSRK
jgi:peptidylprolyl isomerase